MKQHNAIGWHSVMGAILITGVLFTPSYCGTSDVALLLQQSPAQGGTITPGPGVYNFALHSEVTLTAVPKPGYRFICWLGDVADPTASTTVIYLNKPKIIIAVFQQTEYDVFEGASVSGINRIGSYAGGGGGISTSYVPYEPPIPPKPPEPPIPEPATGLLLALGILVMRRRHNA